MKRKILILAENMLNPEDAKTAIGALRYLSDEIVAVVDSSNSGKITGDVIGAGNQVPIVKSIEHGMAYNPDTLLIGIATTGGYLPNGWKESYITEAIERKLHIINGLHEFISEDPKLKQLAENNKVILNDLRKPKNNLHVAKGKWKEIDSKVVLTVGSTQSIGKMTALYEIYRHFKESSIKTDFIGTGQTGILISGKGISVDAVVSDFIAGSIEEEIYQSSKENNELIFVEGQGALTHIGYSGVTLGLIHGSMPDAMIICHRSGHEYDEYGYKLPSLKDLIPLHENIISFFKPTKIVGIALDTSLVSKEEADKDIKLYDLELNLPVTDCIRYGPEKLVDAIKTYLSL
ncbi:DUF1611 domain-containing protein [candidate division KSB1 bacterium]